VTSATLAGGDEREHVTLVGAGFEPGAVLLVNGQPAGIVTGTSGGLLTAELEREHSALVPATLGVGNPDGAAAVTANIRVVSGGSAATPGAGENEGTPQPGGGTRLTPTPGGYGE
jgi:hypothetical protein